jgi:hypothetical protein
MDHEQNRRLRFYLGRIWTTYPNPYRNFAEIILGKVIFPKSGNNVFGNTFINGIN